MSKNYTVVVAGSTIHTVQCAEALNADARFTITSVLTPVPKPIGREQRVTPNPLHQFAVKNHIPTIVFEKRLDEKVQDHVQKIDRPDFLLVVDFGYIIPNWLLDWPKIAPVNVHPSLLPRWRGSAPAQFVMLYGERESSITLLKVSEKLDQGDIITQLPFTVQDTWTYADYYAESFNLMAQELAAVLQKFADNKQPATPQPEQSPTSVARKLRKEDGFVSWKLVLGALEGNNPSLLELTDNDLSQLLKNVYAHHGSFATTLWYAVRALAPWPGIWTVVTTSKGDQRMKLLSGTLKKNKFLLGKVQIEGKQPTLWNEVKNTIKI